MSRQRRASPRLEIERRAHYDHEGSGRFATTRDLGCDGIFLKTPMPLPVGADVDMRLALDPGQKPIALTGRVVRTCIYDDEPGMAVRFSPEELPQSRIAAFLLTAMVQKPRPLDAELSGESWSRLHGMLRLQQTKLDRTQWSLARERADLRAKHEEHEARARALEERADQLEHEEACLMLLDKELEEKAMRLLQRENAVEQRGQELDERAHKLLELAKQVQEQRRMR